MSRPGSDGAGAREPLDAAAARAIRAWRPRGPGERARAFARELVGAARPATPARAKALLFAAARLAAFGESVGLEPCAEALLRPSLIERFAVGGCRTVSPATGRTLRTNLRALHRALEAHPQPAPVPLPRERSKPATATPRSPATCAWRPASRRRHGVCAPARSSAWGRARGSSGPSCAA